MGKELVAEVRDYVFEKCREFLSTGENQEMVGVSRTSVDSCVKKFNKAFEEEVQVSSNKYGQIFIGEPLEKKKSDTILMKNGLEYRNDVMGMECSHAITDRFFSVDSTEAVKVNRQRKGACD